MFQDILLHLLPSLKTHLTHLEHELAATRKENGKLVKKNDSLAKELATIQSAHAKILGILDKEFPTQTREAREATKVLKEKQ